MRLMRKATTPSTAHLSPEDKCLFTVSVSNSSTAVGVGVAGLNWVNSKFGTAALLVGDSLYRITLQIQVGLSREKAEITAEECGRSLIDQIVAVSGSTPTVLRTSDVVKSERFQVVLQELSNAFESNAHFADSVQSDAKIFCDRQLKKGRLFVSYTEGLKLSNKYLLEEVGIYQVLAEAGWLTEAYVGKDLGTLSRLIASKVQGVAPILSQRVFIELGVKPERKSS